MPIWLRRLTYKLLIEFQQKELESYKNSNKNEGETVVNLNNLEQAKKLMESHNNPSYTAKASKK
jgi:hypothetical protein